MRNLIFQRKLQLFRLYETVPDMEAMKMEYLKNGRFIKLSKIDRDTDLLSRVPN